MLVVMADGSVIRSDSEHLLIVVNIAISNEATYFNNISKCSVMCNSSLRFPALNNYNVFFCLPQEVKKYCNIAYILMRRWRYSTVRYF